MPSVDAASFLRPFDINPEPFAGIFVPLIWKESGIDNVHRKDGESAESGEHTRDSEAEEMEEDIGFGEECDWGYVEMGKVAGLFGLDMCEIGLHDSSTSNAVLEQFRALMQQSDGKAKLVVIYYSGHAINKEGKLLARKCKAKTKVNLSALLQYASNRLSHVLVILDCCDSDTAFPPCLPYPYTHVVELLTPGIGDVWEGFTDRVISALYSLRNSGATSTVEDLYWQFLDKPDDEDAPGFYRRVGGWESIVLGQMRKRSELLETSAWRARKRGDIAQVDTLGVCATGQEALIVDPMSLQ